MLAGNLVIYRRDNNEVRWAANNNGLDLGAVGSQPRTLLLANDGNIEYYSGDGTLLWTIGWADTSLQLPSISSGSTLNGPLCSFTEGAQSPCLTFCQPCGPGMRVFRSVQFMCARGGAKFCSVSALTQGSSSRRSVEVSLFRSCLIHIILRGRVNDQGCSPMAMNARLVQKTPPPFKEAPLCKPV